MSAPSRSQIIAEMRRFQVRHATASGCRYAVFAHGQQLSPPSSHRQAIDERDRLTACALQNLFAGGAA